MKTTRRSAARTSAPILLDTHRPTAAVETRRAVARYRETRARSEEVYTAYCEAERLTSAQAADSNDAYDAMRGWERLNAIAVSARADAEAHLIRLILGWDEAVDNRRVQDAETYYWPLRGVIVDGTLYIAAPDDPDDAEGLRPGERREKDSPRQWLTRLHVLPLASIVDFDRVSVR